MYNTVDIYSLYRLCVFYSTLHITILNVSANTLFS